MPSVFFSHSRLYQNLIDYFSNVFTHIGLRGIFYEWQKQNIGYAGMNISNTICNPNTLAVFVLLGKRLENPPPMTHQYTHIWMSFEVGLTSAAGKPIWVFEEFGSFIRFPITLVTDYAQYTYRNTEHLQYYAAVFADRIISQSNMILPHKIIKCQYNGCNAEYNCWSTSEI